MFPNPVLASAAFIHDNSQHVSVPNVSRAAKEVGSSGQLSSPAALFVLGIHFFLCANADLRKNESPKVQHCNVEDSSAPSKSC